MASPARRGGVEGFRPMRALLILPLLALTPWAAAASEAFTGRVVGVLGSDDAPCAAPGTASLWYGRFNESGTLLVLTLDAAACGVPARTEYPWCSELDEPGVLAANHVDCRAAIEPGAPRIWLQPDGYAQASWGAAFMEGAWAPDLGPAIAGDALTGRT